MNIKWWDERVFYQIYPRSFYDSNGDGVGDIQGIIAKLPYLKKLGIGALWISPLYVSPNFDFGYDISDYQDINPEYGTLEDFDELIKAANELDIKIVMDLVINHTSFAHKWFLESKDPQSKYHNYYIWRKGRGKKNKAPNNWQSMFTGSAWTYEQSNDMYYLHLFTKEQPDLNFYHRPVIDEVKNLMEFWLKRGVAGFRCDVINCIYKKSLDNARPRIYKTGRELYLNIDGTHEILKEINRDILAKFDAYTVGETTDITLHEAVAYLDDELTHIFPFDHTQLDYFKLPFIKRKFKPARLVRVLQKWHGVLPRQTMFFENHDIPRIVSRYGDENNRKLSATAYASLTLMMDATPYIYQGQEIGMSNLKITNINEIKDVATLNVYHLMRKLLVPKKLALKLVSHFSRDHARTPVQWSDEKHAGFTSGEPWLAVNNNYNKINVAANLSDDDSIHSNFVKLIALRNESPTIKHGKLVFLKENKNIIGFDRTYNDEVIRVLINLSKKEKRVKSSLDGELLYGNYDEYSDEQVKLRPFEVQIIKK